MKVEFGVIVKLVAPEQAVVAEIPWPNSMGDPEFNETFAANVV